MSPTIATSGGELTVNMVSPPPLLPASPSRRAQLLTPPPPLAPPPLNQIITVPILATILAFVAAGFFTVFVFRESEGNTELKRLSNEVQ